MSEDNPEPNPDEPKKKLAPRSQQWLPPPHLRRNILRQHAHFDGEADKYGTELGDPSIDALKEEFDRERGITSESKEYGMHSVQSRREKRLKQIEKKFMDIKHMDKMPQPAYVLGLPHHGTVTKTVQNPKFQIFYFFLVAFYSFIMGCEMEYDDPKYDKQWFNLNVLFTMAFSAEAFLKLYAYGHTYFLVPWFILEFITTCGAIVALGMAKAGLDETYERTFAMLKVSRIVLLGKLFSMREEFQVIVYGFSRSLVSLWGVFFVILVICYGCTLFCYSVIGKTDYSSQPDFEHSTYFGTIPRTMMTLFSMIVVDEWSGYVRPVYAVQRPVVFFFFIFTVLLTLGLLNVVTGMVVDTVNNVSQDHVAVQAAHQQQLQKNKLEKIVEMVFMDNDERPISEEDFKNHDNKDDLLDMIDTVDFPTSFTLKDLFIVLDFPGHKQIKKTQFVDGVMNFIQGNVFQLDCQILLSINKVFRDIISARKELRVVHHKMWDNFLNPELRPAAEPGTEVQDMSPPKALTRGFSNLSIASNPYGSSSGSDGRDSWHFGTNFSMEALTQEFQNEKKQAREGRRLSVREDGGKKGKKKKVGYSSEGSTGSAGSAGSAGIQPEKKRFFVLNAEDRAAMERPAYLDGFFAHTAVKNLVESAGFQGAYYFFVASYAIVMGAELTYDDPKYDKRWFYLNGVFTFLFCFEVWAKFWSYGHNYFRIPWYLLEFATTFGSVVTMGMKYKGMDDGYEKAFHSIKLSRVLLLGKLFTLRAEFEIIVMGFTRSVFNLWGILFVLLVINYGCTLWCRSIIGKHDYSAYPGYSEEHEEYWGTIPKTMITLFSMMIIDNWSDYSRPVYEEQPIAVLFFFAYTIFLTLGLLNVVTGMVVDTVNAVKVKHEKEEAEMLRVMQKRKLSEIVDIVFRKKREITEEDFVQHSARGELAEMLEVVDFPHHFTLRDFFTIMDSTGLRTMHKVQFVENMVSLINSNNFHRECQILLGVHKMRRSLVELRKEVATIHHRVREAPPPMSAPQDSEQGAMNGSSFKFPFFSNMPSSNGKMDSSASGGDPSLGALYMNLMHPPPEQIRALSAEVRQRRAATSDHWQQLRTTLHDAAMEHCFEELRMAWTHLETEIRTEQLLKSDNAKVPHQLIPEPTSPNTTINELQEHWYVWHKLFEAVSSESLRDLRRALEHAKTVGINEKSNALLYTFCDSLARQQQLVGVSSSDVVQALDEGDWMRALESVVDISLARGADKSLLLNALARLVAESSGYDVLTSAPEDRSNSREAPSGNFSSSQAFASSPSTLGVKLDFAGLDNLKAKAIRSALTPLEKTGDARGRLVSVLHAEAADHAERELKKAWEELDRAYRSADLLGSSGYRGGFGPGFSPCSRQEEVFFIRNQINNAVVKTSLLELRQALSHAVAFGIDMKTMELEVAYRDALSRHHQGPGFSSKHVEEALEKGDWWTVLDDIVGASFARGADRQMLLKMIAKVCSPNVDFHMAGSNGYDKLDNQPAKPNVLQRDKGTSHRWFTRQTSGLSELEDERRGWSRAGNSVTASSI